MNPHLDAHLLENYMNLFVVVLLLMQLLHLCAPPTMLICLHQGIVPAVVHSRVVPLSRAGGT